MVNIWSAAILSVVIVSLISLASVFTFFMNVNRLRQFLLYMVSFAAGAMIGDAFLHLLPEAIEKASNVRTVSLGVLIGIVVFFMLEKFLFWRHCHMPTTEQHPHPVGLMNLISDGVHNFLDGVIIAASYLVSIPLGIATTIAVFLHEIPQEVGDFGILLHAGYTRKKALFFNFLTACLAILGTVVTLILGQRIENFVQFIIPITLGGFIYIAAADLLPEIHGEEHTGRSVLQFFFFIFGIIMMALLLLLE
ncbi:MAG: ZIP family metal transporter [Patescibacteria group bacterium]